MRVGVVTAITCSLPVWMLPSAGGITLNITGMWLPSTSVVSAAAPLYGTSVTSMPVVALNSSADEMRPAAGRRGAERELARLLLGERDQLGDRLRRKVRMRHDADAHLGDVADRREVAAHVVAGIRIERDVDRGRRRIREHQRVAVGRRLRRLPHGDHAVGAAAVLDHDLLAERIGQPLRDQPRDGVVAAARRERHDQRDRARRIGLRSAAPAGTQTLQRTSCGNRYDDHEA